MDEAGNEERLPTFKAPRDLTLTKSGISLSSVGIRSTKKVYVPNIPPRRVRFDQPEPSTSAPRLPKFEPKGPSKEDHRRRKRPEAIQSSSIFEEGAGDGSKTKRHSYPSVPRGRSGESEEYTRPIKSFTQTIIKKEPGTEESEKMDIRNLPEYEDDSDDNEPFVYDSFAPVTVPLRSYLDHKPVEKEEQPRIANAFPPGSFSHIWSSAPKEGTKVLIQLPDHLPVLEQETVDTKESKLADDIRSFPEGFIGKIQIMSSGRARLVLGENYFDITRAATTIFPQEAAVIDTEEKQFTALGGIEKKFICIPDIETLLSEAHIK